MIADLEPLALRACSALGNGVGQGVLLAFCALLGLRCFRRTSAATRYAVLFAALLTLAALPVIHFGLALSDLNPNVSAYPSASLVHGPEIRPESFAEGPGVAAEPPPLRPVWIETGLQLLPRDFVQSPSRATAIDLLPWGTYTVVEEPTEPTEGTVSDDSTPPDLSGDLETLSTAKAASWLTPFQRVLAAPLAPVRFSLPPRVAMGVVAVWLLLAAIRLGCLTWQCVALQRLKRQRHPVPGTLQAQFSEIRLRMGIRRNVDLGTVPDLRSPIAIGFFHPTILMPEALVASTPQHLDPMLRHELAHVQRRDDWTNLVQQVVKAVYFFHPGVLALSRRLTLDREIACDDHVLSAVRAPRDYALLLTDFASRTHGRQWAAAPAAWSNPSQLQERIRMILDPKRNTSPRVAPARMGILTLAALLIAATGIGAAPRLTLNASEDSANPNPEAPSADVAEVRVVEDTGDTQVLLADGTSVRVEVTTDSDVDVDVDPPKEKPARSSGSRSSNSSRNSRVVVRSAGGAELVAPAELPHPAIPPKPSHGAFPAPAPHPDAKPVPAPKPWKAGAEAYVPAPPKLGRVGREAMAWSATTGEERSLEERMRRLEKLVESLVQKKSNPEVMEHKFNYHFEGLGKSMEQVSKEIERSMRDAERSIREAQKNTADVIREKGQTAQEDGAEKALQGKRKALEQQRKVLRKQIEQMQSHVDQLENQLDHLEDEFENAVEAEAERGGAEAEALREAAKAKAKEAKAREAKAKEAREKARAKELEGKPDQGPDSPKVKEPAPPEPPAPGALIRN